MAFCFTFCSGIPYCLFRERMTSNISLYAHLLLKFAMRSSPVCPRSISPRLWIYSSNSLSMRAAASVVIKRSLWQDIRRPSVGERQLMRAPDPLVSYGDNGALSGAASGVEGIEDFAARQQKAGLAGAEGMNAHRPTGTFTRMCRCSVIMSA